MNHTQHGLTGPAGVIAFVAVLAWVLLAPAIVEAIVMLAGW